MLSPSPSPSPFSASPSSQSTSPTNSTISSVSSFASQSHSPPPINFIDRIHPLPMHVVTALKVDDTTKLFPDPLYLQPIPPLPLIAPLPLAPSVSSDVTPTPTAQFPSVLGSEPAAASSPSIDPTLPSAAADSGPPSPLSSSSDEGSDGEDGAASSNPSSRKHRRGRWSAAEDALLKQWVEHYDGKNWKRIAESAFGQSKSDVQCLTGDHRVLTLSGWRSITQVAVGDVVASFHLPTASLQWKRVTATQCFDVVEDEDAFRLFRMQGAGMDVLATRDHRMLVARLRTGGLAREPYHFETVGQLARMAYTPASPSCHSQFAHSGDRAVLRSALNVQPAVKLLIPGMEAVCDWWWQRDQQRGFLRFLGFWLCDGHLSVGRNCVGVSQRRPEGVLWLEVLLQEVFPRWWSRHVIVEDEGGITYGYIIRCPPLYDWFRLLAAGPLGYNPLDPPSLRHYPHFVPGAGLAAEERRHRYRTCSGPSTWTEAEMLKAMSLGPERCWWCEGGEAEEGRELLHCAGDGCGHCGHVGPDCSALTAPPEGRWLCPDCSSDPVVAHADLAAEENAAEEVDVSVRLDEGETEEMEDDAMVDDKEVEEEEDLKDPQRNLHAHVLGTSAAAEAVRATGQVVWHYRQVAAVAAGAVLSPSTSGPWYMIDDSWFALKRWMGANVASTFTQLSRLQAVDLLEGFCRADGSWESVQFGEQGEPVGCWQCSSSSFPLIDHLQLIAQLAGASVDLHLHSPATHPHTVHHWRLHFTFSTKVDHTPVAIAHLAKPEDVTDDVDARGFYEYEDDGKVYDISVEDNHNFLTQRLASTRLRSGENALGIRAQAVWSGNCLHRWQKVLKPGLIKGPWMKAEDDLVCQLVAKYGVKKWCVPL